MVITRAPNCKFFGSSLLDGPQLDFLTETHGKVGTRHGVCEGLDGLDLDG